MHIEKFSFSVCTFYHNKPDPFKISIYTLTQQVSSTRAFGRAKKAASVWGVLPSYSFHSCDTGILNCLLLARLRAKVSIGCTYPLLSHPTASTLEGKYLLHIEEGDHYTPSQ